MVGMSDEAARREIAEGGSTPVFQLAHAIDPKGRLFGSGLRAERASDILHVGETEPWARSGRRSIVAGDLFRPMWTEPRDGGVFCRSFLPLDLANDEEDVVRAFGIEPELTAKIAKGHWRVYEVAISYAGRTYDEGKKIGWKDGVRAVFVISKYAVLTRRGPQ